MSLYGQKVNCAPLLYGNDINVYSLARAFHERYGLRSTVWGKYASGPCYNSNIINYNVCELNDHQECFMQNVWDFADAHQNETVFLFGCGDAYVRLCSDNMGRYPKNVVAPYPKINLVDALFHKEHFYRICQQYDLVCPETFIYRRDMGDDYNLPFKAPYILKPANPIMYWQAAFPTQKKVYLLKDREELENTLNLVYSAGYTDTMIVQDFIPGDDTYMRVMTGYSNKEGQVELMALGHVLLEEHTPLGIGNHAVIINDYNKALSYQLKEFLEAIGFVGFFNFDLKYDPRDGLIKTLELNVRQGRSNYYVTGAGYNLAEYVVNDHLFNKPADFSIVKEKCLWSVVPRSVMFNYIHPQVYRDEIMKLLKTGCYSNPLYYKADLNLKRRLSLLKSQWGHIYNFRRYLRK